MRYLNSDLDQPSPPYVRLWEARRGIYVGFGLCIFYLALPVVALFVLAAFERGIGGTNYGYAGLWFVWRMRSALLLLVCYSTCLVWKQELDLVNQESESPERILDRRLKAIEQRVFPERFPQQDQS
jgi:hypothetical protein